VTEDRTRTLAAIDAEEPADRKRRLARDRQRRRRERIRDGRQLLTIEVDDISLADALVETGDLAQWDQDDPERIALALSEAISGWLARHA
jgi:hypothetical protein